MPQAIAAALACALILTVWMSAARTVFTPRDAGTFAARWATRLVTSPFLVLAGSLPKRARERLLDMCAPVALFTMAACWLVGVVAGFSALAWALYGVPSRSESLGSFFMLRSKGEALAAVGLLSTALLLAAITTHLVWFTGAYGRRELLAARLSGQAERPPDAETVLADFLRTGSREHLDAMFAEWAGWVADVRATHIGSPALTFARPASELCWIDAAVIVLDVAGLTQALAPSWTPPHTRVLINNGSRCLQHLAAELGLMVFEPPVNLQGREEQAFAESLKIVKAAGLHPERGEPAARAVFQELRARYAPYGSAIRIRLLYPPAEAMCRGRASPDHSSQGDQNDHGQD